jgi:hypothetical protein
MVKILEKIQIFKSIRLGKNTTNEAVKNVSFGHFFLQRYFLNPINAEAN